MKPSTDFRVPEPAAAERRLGRSSDAAATPPSGAGAAKNRRTSDPDRSSPENPNR